MTSQVGGSALFGEIRDICCEELSHCEFGRRRKGFFGCEGGHAGEYEPWPGMNMAVAAAAAHKWLRRKQATRQPADCEVGDVGHMIAGGGALRYLSSGLERLT